MGSPTTPLPVSPSSSPRLPSPPPFTEVQIGPKSPSIKDNSSSADSQYELRSQAKNEGNATRRIRPGSKTEDMASGPPLVPLGDLDSAFQLQEHLKSLHYTHTHPSPTSPNFAHTVPLTRETASILATPPDGIDRALWLYELCRLLTQQTNSIVLALFTDEPPCSSTTCPEMRASEWQYLCAVHDPPKPCCAIDYCCHTLDWAANLLTSTKHFPSRLTLGGDGSGGDSAGGGGTSAGLRHLLNIFRRLYRIFAHAWYQHRSAFWQVEGREGLYVFFKTVCDMYQQIPEDNYTIPPEAEGIESSGDQDHERIGVNRILRRDEGEGPEDPTLAAPEDTQAFANTTRRHKSTLSTSSSVAAVPEEDEDEREDDATAEGEEEVEVFTEAAELDESLAGQEKGGTGETALSTNADTGEASMQPQGTTEKEGEKSTESSGGRKADAEESDQESKDDATQMATEKEK
ncbi:MAG: hypothetical protein M1817_006295 [Caeruleum heppii]|nr:MAG: hypothetical protein M1817_006295 [Caeruleum heppii]